MDREADTTTWKHPHWCRRFRTSGYTLLAAILAAASISVALRLTWNPTYENYLQYAPIGGLLAAFELDRLLNDQERTTRNVICDLSTVVLALMRVFVPPLPFVSGHSLFVSYVVATAGTWTLRCLALLVMAQVVVVKLFNSPGVPSLLGGIAAAAVISRLRTNVEVTRRVLNDGG